MSSSVLQEHPSVATPTGPVATHGEPTSLVLVGSLHPERVAATLARRRDLGPCRFHLVVPAVRASEAVVGLAHSERLTSLPGQDVRFVVARWRLGPVLEASRCSGLDVTGEVDLPTPLRVVRQALARLAVENVVLLGDGRVWSRGGTPALRTRLRRLPIRVLEL